MQGGNAALEAVRVKAQLLDDNDRVINGKKFSLDPSITTFDMLRSLLAKAFDIKGDFSLSYLALDHESSIVELPILNEWDLDAAILSSSQPSLRINVTLKDGDETLDDWDVIPPNDIPIYRPHDESKKKDTFLDNITDRLSSMLGKKGRSNSNRISKTPMNRAEFGFYMDSNGRFVNEKAFRESIFQGGVEPCMRKETWKHLLNVFPPDLTSRERKDYIQLKIQEYYKLKQQWKQTFDSGCLTEEMRFVTSMVRKDVIRTDRTHPFFRGEDNNQKIESLFHLLCTYSLNHCDVSYCQGMSDMASVLLVVQEDEASAYICFCSLMKRLKHNFLFDGKAMQCKFDHLKLLLSYYDPELWTYLIENEVNDLFFSYRWLLLELKREFPFDDCLYMLEVMWSTLPIDSPVDGVKLTEIRPDDPTSPSTLNHSSSVGTPTPYTKLRSLCRRSSCKSNHLSCSKQSSLNFDESDDENVEHSKLPTVTDEENDSSPTITKSDLLVSSDKMSEKSSLASYNGVVNSNELSSHFYLTVGQTQHGSLIYLGADTGTPDNPRLNIASSTSSDSGIRSQPDTPCKVEFSEPDLLQFAFESSDEHSKPKSKSRAVFPPPDEFGYGNPFLMFATLTMILQHRDHIIKNKLDFDSIVLLFDRSVRKNDVNKILCKTRLLYQDYIAEQRYHGWNNDYHINI